MATILAIGDTIVYKGPSILFFTPNILFILLVNVRIRVRLINKKIKKVINIIINNYNILLLILGGFPEPKRHKCIRLTFKIHSRYLVSKFF